jgi:hypothetical protein
MSDVGPSAQVNGHAPLALGLIVRGRTFDPFSTATQRPFRGAAKAAPSVSTFIRDTCTGDSRASIGDARAHQRGAA